MLKENELSKVKSEIVLYIAFPSESVAASELYAK